MPKQKTNKAAKKRFKVTGTGKIMKCKTKRRHLMTDKSSDEKRKLRGWTAVAKNDEKRFVRLLPYR